MKRIFCDHSRSRFYLVLLLILAGSGLFGQTWLTDLGKAEQEATSRNCHIILVFQGSDWCAPCIKLNQEIWQSEEFKAYASEHAVLLKADFPRKAKNQLPPDQLKKNERLAEKYNKQGFFPLVVVLDNEGNVLGTTGYKKTTPEAYIATLEAFK
ncbi:MAG: thioredoxin family protein [Saprospiraceae bacterium]